MQSSDFDIHPTQSFADASTWSRYHGDAALDALLLAVRDGDVFAALLGRQRSGKSQVMHRLSEACTANGLRPILISEPSEADEDFGSKVRSAARAGAGKFPGRKRVVLLIDNAHRAAPALLDCLEALAAMRGVSAPQVILAGEMSLLAELRRPGRVGLDRRTVIRHVLPEAVTRAAPRDARVEGPLTAMQLAKALVAADSPVWKNLESEFAVAMHLANAAMADLGTHDLDYNHNPGQPNLTSSPP